MRSRPAVVTPPWCHEVVCPATTSPAARRYTRRSNHGSSPRALLRSSRAGRIASPRGLDGGDVDLLHRHHRVERALCLAATSRKRLAQHTRGDLPGEAPAILAPAALALLAAVADDRVPVAVRLFLVVRRDLEGKRLAVLERRTTVETET